MTRLRVWKGDHDISQDLVLRGGRALPGGWSQYELVYVARDPEGHPSAEEHVGWLESGAPSDFAEGFRFALEELVEDG